MSGKVELFNESKERMVEEVKSMILRFFDIIYFEEKFKNV